MPFPDISSVIQTLVSISVIILGSGGVLLYFYQNELIYPSRYPPGSRVQVAKPNEVGLHDWEDITIKTPDKIDIKAYLIRNREKEEQGVQTQEGLRTRTGKPNALAKRTILYLHANAGNMVFISFSLCSITLHVYEEYVVCIKFNL